MSSRPTFNILCFLYLLISLLLSVCELVRASNFIFKDLTLKHLKTNHGLSVFSIWWSDHGTPWRKHVSPSLCFEMTSALNSSLFLQSCYFWNHSIGSQRTELTLYVNNTQSYWLNFIDLIFVIKENGNSVKGNILNLKTFLFS